MHGTQPAEHGLRVPAIKGQPGHNREHYGAADQTDSR